MNEVLPPDVKKGEERGIDTYLSESLDILLSNPKLLVPFIPALLAVLIYGIYILLRGGSLLHPRPETLEFFSSKNFIIASIAVTVIVLLSSLTGMLGVSYFLLRKGTTGEAIRSGLKRLPLTLISYAVLLALLMVAYVPLLFLRNVVFIIMYAVIISILMVPPLFLLPPLLVDRTFPVVDSFNAYAASFKKALVLAVLYSLISSAVSSLIPLIGSFLDILIVIPMFTAAYTMLYEDLKMSADAS